MPLEVQCLNCKNIREWISISSPGYYRIAWVIFNLKHYKIKRLSEVQMGEDKSYVIFEPKVALP